MTAQRPAAAVGSIEELFQRAARGDVHAFARIIRQEHEAMTRLAMVVTGDAGSASGAASRACSRAWQGIRRARLGDPHEWLAWLAASEAARPAFRIDPLYDGLDGEAEQVPAPTTSPVLAGLDPGDRALLTLSLVAGIPDAMLARCTGMRPADVTARLERLVVEAAVQLDPAVDRSGARVLVARHLRARAAGPVPQVDADRVARRAVADASNERARRISVAISAVVGVLAVTYPYWVPLLFRR